MMGYDLPRRCSVNDVAFIGVYRACFDRVSSGLKLTCVRRVFCRVRIPEMNICEKATVASSAFDLTDESTEFWIKDRTASLAEVLGQRRSERSVG